MNKVVCFTTEEVPHNPGKYIICPVHANFHLEHTTGSFHVIAARVMNLSYAQYLRFCRDICKAEIVGKGTKYPIPYFKRGEMLNMLVRTLNTRANVILWERENPEWEEHAAEVRMTKEYECYWGQGDINEINK